MTRPINLAQYRGRRAGIPAQLLLQRLDPETGTYGTIRCLDGIPYTREGYEACAAELQRQADRWHHNYQPFFGSQFRIAGEGK